jgi:RNA polymerase sigma factor (sigma-70 family)
MPGPRLIRIASDARLVSLVREGRVGAFEAMYDRYHRGILSFCRHMLGDQHEAEDAVQHTFMAAYSSLLASQRPIHLRPWLYAIARNRCYSVLRGQRERPTAELEEPATDGLAAEVQRRQDLRDLVSDLHELPTEQREAIVLAELDCLSHAEIAEVLGVPRDKVKALVFQARESLLASRTARDISCHEIRQQLAVGRGAALRRGNLRRHLRECEGCRAYRAQVQHQRRQFALLLPIAPTLLAKEGLIAAAVGAGGAAAVGGTGLIATSAIKTGVLKGVAAAVIAGIGTVGTVVVSASDLPVRAVQAAGANHPGHTHLNRATHRGVAPAGSSSVTGSYAGTRVARAAHPLSRRYAVREHAGRRGTATHRHGNAPAHRHGAASASASVRTGGHGGYGHGRWAGWTASPGRASHASLAHPANYVGHVPPGWTHRSGSGLPPGQAKKLARLASYGNTHVAAAPRVHEADLPRHATGGTHRHVQYGVTRHVAAGAGHGHVHGHIQYGVIRQVAGRSTRGHAAGLGHGHH